MSLPDRTLMKQNAPVCSSPRREAAGQPTHRSPFRALRFWFVTILVILVCGAALLARFGGTILVGEDPLPEHADVAVMLAGGDSAEEARLDMAMQMLRERRVDDVMLSVRQVSFYGEWLPDLLLHHVGRKYGPELARNVVLCEMSTAIDSTAGEAVALRQCLEARGWRSVIVVTSNFHTRRARLIWRAILANAEPHFRLSTQGVFDGSFEPDGWWEKRRYAKTWLLEMTKLVWTVLFERPRARMAGHAALSSLVFVEGGVPLRARPARTISVAGMQLQLT